MRVRDKPVSKLQAAPFKGKIILLKIQKNTRILQQTSMIQSLSLLVFHSPNCSANYMQ